jgi:hypothetical protein
MHCWVGGMCGHMKGDDRVVRLSWADGINWAPHIRVYTYWAKISEQDELYLGWWQSLIWAGRVVFRLMAIFNLGRYAHTISISIILNASQARSNDDGRVACKSLVVGSWSDGSDQCKNHFRGTVYACSSTIHASSLRVHEERTQKIKIDPFPL